MPCIVTDAPEEHHHLLPDQMSVRLRAGTIGQRLLRGGPSGQAADRSGFAMLPGSSGDCCRRRGWPASGDGDWQAISC